MPIQNFPLHSDFQNTGQTISSNDDYFCKTTQMTNNNNWTPIDKLIPGDLFWLDTAYLDHYTQRPIFEHRRYMFVTYLSHTQLLIAKASHRQSPATYLQSFDFQITNEPQGWIQPCRMLKLARKDLPTKVYVDRKDLYGASKALMVHNELVNEFNQLPNKCKPEIDPHNHQPYTLILNNDETEIAKINNRQIYIPENGASIEQQIETARTQIVTPQPITPTRIKHIDFIQQEFPNADSKQIATILSIPKIIYANNRNRYNTIKQEINEKRYDDLTQTYHQYQQQRRQHRRHHTRQNSGPEL